MKTAIYFTLCLLFVFNLLKAQTPDNTKPHYGNVVKSQEYIDSDNEFIDIVVKQYGSREIAAKEHIKFGWDYLKKGDKETAMKRFNQAWLLDSTLSDVNWGYGAVLGANGQFDQSIYYLKKYYDSNPQNNRILIDIATAYFQYANSLKQQGMNDAWILNIGKGKSCIKKSLLINDKNAYAYSQLAIAYYYENKIDSAKYYGLIANELDPKVLHPQFKKAVGID
ncbi:tetratricopeptide repeat protein [Bacteroidota bacterium]